MSLSIQHLRAAALAATLATTLASVGSTVAAAPATDDAVGTTSTAEIAPTDAKAPLAKSGDDNALTAAALAPLNDLNLVRTEIPPVLKAARSAPYARPLDRSCAAIGEAIVALDAVLGADLDARTGKGGPDLLERSAHGALRSAAEGAIPFRGWVRKLTGAERNARDLAAAIAAGTVRRAYLKGMGDAAGCAAPAAPAAPVLATESAAQAAPATPDSATPPTAPENAGEPSAPPAPTGTS